MLLRDPTCREISLPVALLHPPLLASLICFLFCLFAAPEISSLSLRDNYIHTDSINRNNNNNNKNTSVIFGFLKTGQQFLVNKSWIISIQTIPRIELTLQLNTFPQYFNWAKANQIIRPRINLIIKRAIMIGTATNSANWRPKRPSRQPKCHYSTVSRLMIQLIVQMNWTMISTQTFSGTETHHKASRISPIIDVQFEPPLRPIFPLQPMAEGPGFDVVAFNRRRFELDHHHEDPNSSSGSNLDQQLRRGQSIEADLSALSNRLMAAVPGDLTKQILESVNVDSSFITGGGGSGGSSSSSSSSSAGSLLQSVLGDADSSSLDDPDGASIARLTKSCLTVHASSARPDQLDVKFYLYTKSNPQKAHLLTPQVTRLELLRGSPFEPDKPIKWITHGFHTNVDKSEWMLEAKDKILQFEDANVILTDWRRGASPALAFYPKAAANAHVVAKFIVRILRRLKDDIDLSQVHLIGHSLGAHIMGFVGSAFTEEHLMRQQQLISLGPSKTMFWRAQNKQPSKLLIGRITACDPALPCFGPSSSGPVKENSQSGPAATYRISEEQQQHLRQQKSSSSAQPDAARDSAGSAFIADGAADWTPSMWTHLRPDSAITVEVIHSNPGVMGYVDPLGDFDFYPNGFERQPGCGKEPPESPNGGAKSGAQSPTTATNTQLPYRRMKRQWASVLDGVMSTIVHPLVSNTSGLQLSRPNPHQAIAAVAQQQVRTARTEATRFSQTIDRFLNPIKSFFKGNTCSHHRSVEYMVESLYYERVPQDRKLDRDLVCQMVGYRCQDYASFKKGFCFRCLNGELDCRAFGMSVTPTSQKITTDSVNLLRSSQPEPSQGRYLNLLNHIDQEKFRPKTLVGGRKNPLLQGGETKPHSELSTSSSSLSWQNNLKNTTRRIVKRVLPTFDQYSQNYQPLGRNQYFFDTKSSKSFCLHHYHIHVKYRWFRVRENLMLDGFRLLGTLANLTRKTPIQLHKFTHNSYTALLSEPLFLGQIESLIIFGARVKPTLIEYIEVTFMSNLDPKVRALGSAKLCRAPTASTNPSADASYRQSTTNDQIGDQLDGGQQPPADSLFVRCSGSMVR